MKLIKPKSLKFLKEISVNPFGMFLYYTASMRFYTNDQQNNCDAQVNWWNPIGLILITGTFITIPFLAMFSDESVQDIFRNFKDELLTKADTKRFPHII